jgi:hypothetical protein
MQNWTNFYDKTNFCVFKKSRNKAKMDYAADLTKFDLNDAKMEHVKGFRFLSFFK